MAGDGAASGASIDADVPFTAEELFRAAQLPRRKGRLTVAGRALWKHAPAYRPGSPYPTPAGDALHINRVAHSIIDEILGNAGTRVYVYRGRFVHAWLPAPDRRGARWNLDGSFNAFLDKP